MVIRSLMALVETWREREKVEKKKRKGDREGKGEDAKSLRLEGEK